MTLMSAAPCVKATSRSSTARPQKKNFPHPEAKDRGVKDSMPAWGLFHCRQLLGTGRALMRRLPGFVGHAVDGLAALVLAHRRTLGVGFFLEPIGQAIAAEAREIHQIDVLDVAAGAQMFDQAPEHRRFKFRSGLLVDRHGLLSRLLSRCCVQNTDIRWGVVTDFA